MKFEYIILLIIAFNVVTALIKKRKDRAAQTPVPSAPTRAESARAQNKKADARDEMGRARDSYEARDGEDLESPAQAKRSGMGRDLLEQLAKELGLETAQPERPRPEVSAYKPEAVPEVVAVVPPATHRAPRRVTAPVAPTAPAAPARPVLARELRDPEGLRRAFIVKEVLGPPVSRRNGR